jgi:dihydroneopterin aldolase
MPDLIEIQGLRVAAKVGVPDLERRIPQGLEIDLTLICDFRDLADDLARTADYAAVSDLVRCECAAREFRLIESLADHLAASILAAFPATAEVALTVRKFVVPATRHVAVKVTRRRG